LEELHAEDDEPVAEEVKAFDFDFELYDISREDFKKLIYNEIMLYHDQELRERYELDKINHPEGNLEEKFGQKPKKSASFSHVRGAESL
jgi:hypothetical protein